MEDNFIYSNSATANKHRLNSEMVSDTTRIRVFVSDIYREKQFSRSKGLSLSFLPVYFVQLILDNRFYHCQHEVNTLEKKERTSGSP